MFILVNIKKNTSNSATDCFKAMRSTKLKKDMTEAPDGYQMSMYTRIESRYVSNFFLILNQAKNTFWLKD